MLHDCLDTNTQRRKVMAASPTVAEKSMKVSLDKWKFTQCREGGLGLLVTIGSKYLPLSPDIDTAIVGQCACLPASKKIAKLSSLGLPTPDWEETAASVQRHFPAGFENCCGVWFRVDSTQYSVSDGEVYKGHLSKVLEAVITTTNLKSFLKYKPSLLVAVPTKVGSVEDVKCYTFNSNASDIELSPVVCVPGSVGNHLVKNTVMVRLSASVPLFLTNDTDVKGAVTLLTQRMQSPSTFFFLPSHHLLFNDSTPEEKLLPAPSKEDLRNSKSSSSLSTASKQWRQLGFNANTIPASSPLTMNILEKASPSNQDKEENGLYAPTLSVSEPLSSPCVKINVPLDVLGFLRPTLPLFEVAKALKSAITAQLNYTAGLISWQDNMVNGVKLFATPLHSQVSPVMIAIQDKFLKLEKGDSKEDKGQLSYTTAICRGPPGDKLLTQPNLRQLLSLRSAVDDEYFQILSTVLAGQQLKNPHLAVKHSRIAGGRMALVQGDYLYYHYMQDGFNDNVWGCAYRSLQTLASWFLLQMYTAKAPPTHRQIQQALVDVGDKEASLVGSKEWIGSFEVSTCLDHLLGVQCKIQHCSSGADMASLGSMLLSHFQIHGTPIMIGGGVLAHTILGVDYSGSTGEIQFLILDPHYTGKDELKTIIDKGWCGWKPVSFWDRTAHYNLCMPLTDKP